MLTDPTTPQVSSPPRPSPPIRSSPSVRSGPGENPPEMPCKPCSRQMHFSSRRQARGRRTHTGISTKALDKFKVVLDLLIRDLTRSPRPRRRGSLGDCLGPFRTSRQPVQTAGGWAGQNLEVLAAKVRRSMAPILQCNFWMCKSARILCCRTIEQVSKCSSGRSNAAYRLYDRTANRFHLTSPPYSSSH